ncbi:tRNA pseudouridine(55) synthase TruB [Gemmatimonadota bacterium]
MSSPTGILLVDKPSGPTSHDVVARVRRAAGSRKVGHAGTLDPFASGLLLLLLGPATRLSEYFLGMGKDYEAVARLGVETTTHDPEGDVVREDPGWKELRPDDVEEALAGLRGSLRQLPPSFSAKKVRGESAHHRARRGEVVELEPVTVTVESLVALDLQLPELRFRVRCSSGTYVRALARDLGRALGVGAHLTFLRRTGIGPFTLSSAHDLETVEKREDLPSLLLSPALALAHLPSLEVGPEEAMRICQGQFLPLQGEELPQDIPIRVLLGGELLAVAARKGDHLRPRKVFARD